MITGPAAQIAPATTKENELNDSEPISENTKHEIRSTKPIPKQQAQMLKTEYNSHH
jgi:hypothetical protein